MSPKAIIAWNGDINDVVYIIDKNDVDLFMSRYNHSGAKWVVVSDRMNVCLSLVKDN